MLDCYPVPREFTRFKDSLDEFGIDDKALDVITTTLVEVFAPYGYVEDEELFCLEVLNNAYVIASRIAYDRRPYLHFNEYVLSARMRAREIQADASYAFRSHDSVHSYVQSVHSDCDDENTDLQFEEFYRLYDDKDLELTYDALMSVVLLLVADNRNLGKLYIRIMKSMHSLKVWDVLRARWRYWHENDLQDYIQPQAGDEDTNSQTQKLNNSKAQETGLPKSPFTIASGKQTSVLVVLDAMYRAGWIKRADGSDYGSRDEMVGHLMSILYNKESANIKQLLNAAANRTYEGKKKYFDELLSYIAKEQDDSPSR